MLYREVIDFIGPIKKLMQDITKQHDKVNSQHNELSNITKDIQNHFLFEKRVVKNSEVYRYY